MGKMAPIEVYGMPLSAPCRIVNMTAECLGLEYNFKVVDLMAGEHMKPEFLALNPMHNIPTMVDGDFVMNESRAIAAYLVNKYGKDDKLSAGNDEMTIGDLALVATYSTLKAANLSGIDLSEFKNAEVWFEKCCKLVPNYEKTNGEGAAAFGGFYQSKVQ